jgi:hypothetical protein
MGQVAVKKGVKKKPFDPEGAGYDYQSALKAGLEPDETGHWPSREPYTGLLLKGRTHKTWGLTEAEERRLRYKIVKKNGRYYSFEKERK